MSLTPGTRFGPYESQSVLGAGGMGKVYRARDTRLGRDVAIKILADDFVHDPERTARFQREAQVLAALNHPHIAQTYGLGLREWLRLRRLPGRPALPHRQDRRRAGRAVADQGHYELDGHAKVNLHIDHLHLVKP
jgi:hypothetical protein